MIATSRCAEARRPFVAIRAISFFAISLLLLCFSSQIVLGVDFEQMQQSLLARFGPSSSQTFKNWQRMLTESTRLVENEKLRKVNNFFNSQLQFNDDIEIWGTSDYWATPLESIGKGVGDCEDFSIAKYYSLMELGVPVSRLRLVYVKAKQEGPNGPVLQAHMVLAYYPTPTAEPLVLDNLKTAILPASKRDDLTPIFSFNSDGLWHGTGNQASKSNLSRWQDLLQRARNEGFH